MDISKVLDWLKLSPKYLIPIALLTGAALFLPTNILDIFGITSLVVQYRPFVGITFLVAIALLATELTIKIYNFIIGIRQKSSVRKNRQQRLQSLTNEEKEILRGYISEKTRTQYLDIQDGIVNGLEVAGIIYRASLVGQLDNWAYNIQPWAWDYLNQCPELLKLTARKSH